MISNYFRPKKTHSQTLLISPLKRLELKKIHPEKTKEFRLTVILLVHCSVWLGVTVVGDVGVDVDTLPDGIFSSVFNYLPFFFFVIH